MSDLYILTGASRGLGAALAERLGEPGHHLLLISRRRPADLLERVAAGGATCEHWSIDLSQTLPAAARLQSWLGGVAGQPWATATLINNAAALTRVGPVDDGDDAELSAALRVNLEAPVLLTAAFLRATRGWSAVKRVLQISSGLASRAMAAQAPYCAAKAGLDHFTRALALDEAARSNGARVVSLAPGVIDTDMQAHLRAGEPSTFPEQSRFLQLQADGALATPQETARRVLAYLARPDFGQHPVADVRQA